MDEIDLFNPQIKGADNNLLHADSVNKIEQENYRLVRNIPTVDNNIEPVIDQPPLFNPPLSLENYKHLIKRKFSEDTNFFNDPIDKNLDFTDVVSNSVSYDNEILRNMEDELSSISLSEKSCKNIDVVRVSQQSNLDNTINQNFDIMMKDFKEQNNNSQKIESQVESLLYKLNEEIQTIKIFEKRVYNLNTTKNEFTQECEEYHKEINLVNPDQYISEKFINLKETLKQQIEELELIDSGLTSHLQNKPLILFDPKNSQRTLSVEQELANKLKTVFLENIELKEFIKLKETKIKSQETQIQQLIESYDALEEERIQYIKSSNITQDNVNDTTMKMQLVHEQTKKIEDLEQEVEGLRQFVNEKNSNIVSLSKDLQSVFQKNQEEIQTLQNQFDKDTEEYEKLMNDKNDYIDVLESQIKQFSQKNIIEKRNKCIQKDDKEVIFHLKNKDDIITQYKEKLDIVKDERDKYKAKLIRIKERKLKKISTTPKIQGKKNNSIMDEIMRLRNQVGLQIGNVNDDIEQEKQMIQQERAPTNNTLQIKQVEEARNSFQQKFEEFTQKNNEETKAIQDSLQDYDQRKKKILNKKSHTERVSKSTNLNASRNFNKKDKEVTIPPQTTHNLLQAKKNELYKEDLLFNSNDKINREKMLNIFTSLELSQNIKGVDVNSQKILTSNKKYENVLPKELHSSIDKSQQNEIQLSKVNNLTERNSEKMDVKIKESVNPWQGRSNMSSQQSPGTSKAMKKTCNISSLCSSPMQSKSTITRDILISEVLKNDSTKTLDLSVNRGSQENLPDFVMDNFVLARRESLNIKVENLATDSNVINEQNGELPNYLNCTMSKNSSTVRNFKEKSSENDYLNTDLTIEESFNTKKQKLSYKNLPNFVSLTKNEESSFNPEQQNELEQLDNIANILSSNNDHKVSSSITNNKPSNTKNLDFTNSYESKKNDENIKFLKKNKSSRILAVVPCFSYNDEHVSKSADKNVITINPGILLCTIIEIIFEKQEFNGIKKYIAIKVGESVTTKTLQSNNEFNYESYSFEIDNEESIKLKIFETYPNGNNQGHIGKAKIYINDILNNKDSISYYALYKKTDNVNKKVGYTKIKFKFYPSFNEKPSPSKFVTSKEQSNTSSKKHIDSDGLVHTTNEIKVIPRNMDDCKEKSKPEDFVGLIKDSNNLLIPQNSQPNKVSSNLTTQTQNSDQNFLRVNHMNHSEISFNPEGNNSNTKNSQFTFSKGIGSIGPISNPQAQSFGPINNPSTFNANKITNEEYFVITEQKKTKLEENDIPIEKNYEIQVIRETYSDKIKHSNLSFSDTNNDELEMQYDATFDNEDSPDDSFNYENEVKSLITQKSSRVSFTNAHTKVSNVKDASSFVYSEDELIQLQLEKNKSHD